jgi:hypothetical protein
VRNGAPDFSVRRVIAWNNSSSPRPCAMGCDGKTFSRASGHLGLQRAYMAADADALSSRTLANHVTFSQLPEIICSYHESVALLKKPTSPQDRQNNEGPRASPVSWSASGPSTGLTSVIRGWHEITHTAIGYRPQMPAHMHFTSLPQPFYLPLIWRPAHSRHLSHYTSPI